MQPVTERQIHLPSAALVFTAGIKGNTFGGLAPVNRTVDAGIKQIQRIQGDCAFFTQNIFVNAQVQVIQSFLAALGCFLGGFVVSPHLEINVMGQGKPGSMAGKPAVRMGTEVFLEITAINYRPEEIKTLV